MTSAGRQLSSPTYQLIFTLCRANRSTSLHSLSQREMGIELGSAVYSSIESVHVQLALDRSLMFLSLDQALKCPVSAVRRVLSAMSGTGRGGGCSIHNKARVDRVWMWLGEATKTRAANQSIGSAFSLVDDTNRRNSGSPQLIKDSDIATALLSVSLGLGLF